jgi:hypothetical protein
MLNGSEQIESENAEQAVIVPIEKLCGRGDEATQERWRPIIEDVAAKPINDFRRFTHKLAMIAGLSYDHELAHAAYEYLDSLYQMSGLRKDESAGRRDILRACFYLHPDHHPDYCNVSSGYMCETLPVGAAELDWQEYSVDQARKSIDGWAKDPLNKLEEVCNMVAEIADNNRSSSRCRIAGQRYLERLLCLVWLKPEEREAIVPALAIFQEWRNDYCFR